jgi:hypothetical protein
LVPPEDEKTLAQIERAVGSKLPRVILDDFAYDAVPSGKPERPSRGSNGGRGRRPNKGRNGR